jgi:hypothetical protein
MLIKYVFLNFLLLLWHLHSYCLRLMFTSLTFVPCCRSLTCVLLVEMTPPLVNKLPTLRYLWPGWLLFADTQALCSIMLFSIERFYLSCAQGQERFIDIRSVHYFVSGNRAPGSVWTGQPHTSHFCWRSSISFVHAHLFAIGKITRSKLSQFQTKNCGLYMLHFGALHT